jgi:hypothetical protein
MEFVNVHGLIAERAIQSANDLENHQVCALRTPGKNLIFAYGHGVWQAMIGMDHAIDSAFRNHLAGVVLGG